jgi:hypothetical protein
VKSSISTDLLLFFLSFNTCFYHEELRIKVIEHLRLDLGSESLDKGVLLEIEPHKDISDHFFVI